jgi:GT2 family glycosyltransferase
MKLATVIPAYNHLPDIMHALNSLRALAHTNPAFHVQDDCSPEVNLPLCVPREIASTSRNERNLGFAANANLGAWEAIAQYQPDVILFCNQDIYGVSEWSAGWDAALLSAFSDPSVGIVGSRLLFPNGSIQNAGGEYDQLAQPVHRCLGWTNPRHPECNMRQTVDWTTGAALAIRTSLFVKLNGFDEGYRMYFEDTSLCIRAKEAGYKVVFEPACTLIHGVGSTGGSPHFMDSARRFKQEFVDTRRVQPGRLMPTFRWW